MAKAKVAKPTKTRAAKPSPAAGLRKGSDPITSPAAGQKKGSDPITASGSRTGGAFPFLYKNHGSLALESFTKASGAYVGFKAAPTKSQLETIVRKCPAPIRGFVGATDTLFSIESFGDTFDWEVLEHYGTENDKADSMKSGRAEFEQVAARRFAGDVEKWAMSVHAIAPIAFFIGPCASDGEDPWDADTRERLVPVMVDFIEKFVERNKLRPDHDDTAGPEEVVPLTRTHIACLLQELDEDMGVTIPKALAPRIAKLKKAFPL